MADGGRAQWRGGSSTCYLALFLLMSFKWSSAWVAPSKVTGWIASPRSQSVLGSSTGSSRCHASLKMLEGEQDAGNAFLELKVTGSSTQTLLPTHISSHGRLLRSSDGKQLQAVPPNADVSVHILTGITSEGQEFVAFADPSAVKAVINSKVKVASASAFEKPRGLSSDQACMLLYLALELLPPLMKAGVHTVMEEGEAQNRRKRTGVVTGAGPQAQFALQVLRAWGFRVVACSRRKGDELRKTWGAEDVVDYSQESFSERTSGQGLTVVVDSLGQDVDGLANSLQRLTGATYVSTMPSTIRRMQSQGLLQAASLFGSVFLGRPEAAATSAYWLPERQGREVLSYALSLAESGSIQVPTQPPGMDDYMDATLWPKDAESDYRFGFPSVGESEGSERGLSDAALLRRYTQAALGDGAGELDAIMAKFRSSFRRMGEGAPTREDWKSPTVVFVTAPNCKVCMYTKPRVAQLADEFKSSVQFWHMVADPDKYMVAEMLQVKSYPFFIVYAGGERLSTHNALGPELVKEVFTVAKMRNSPPPTNQSRS